MKHMRPCSNCGEIKSPENFARGGNTECRECAKTRTSKWKQENRAKYLAYLKKYKSTPEHKEKHRTYMREHMRRMRAASK